MDQLLLHEFHRNLGARFTTVDGQEAVANYGEKLREYLLLREGAALLDLSFRSRVCLTGSDRIRFLHGQVTNDIKNLGQGSGCYAALTTAKGKLETDLNIYRLEEELLLDFEPGLTERVTGRLERYIIADDVQVVDVSKLYGLLTVQGPQATVALQTLSNIRILPERPFQHVKVSDPAQGDLYIVHQPRLGTCGYDWFVPAASLGAVAQILKEAIAAAGGGIAGWDALELLRVERGIPRFGIDMDENHFPQEAGIESRAVSYTKGCYIGQEVLNRIHTLGHVNRELRLLRLTRPATRMPQKGDKLFHNGKESGYLTSAVDSPALNARIALGYVRKEAAALGQELTLDEENGQSRAVVISPPFQGENPGRERE